MLSKKQKDWLNHLSDINRIKILPYDTKFKDIFHKQKKIIEGILGEGVNVLHEGASALGISGKGDIDIYVPVSVREFNSTFEKLKSSLGEPGSYYQDERVRWNQEFDNTEVEISLVNQDADFWKDSMVFWDYLKSHPETLEEYRIIKEEAEGRSTREYYFRKTEFINKILEVVRNNRPLVY